MYLINFVHSTTQSTVKIEELRVPLFRGVFLKVWLHCKHKPSFLDKAVCLWQYVAYGEC